MTGVQTCALPISGETNILLEGDFVGVSRIENISPNQTFKLSAGIDEEITVKKEKIINKVNESSLFTKNKIIDITYKIEIESHKKEPHKITIIDHIPVSRDHDIEVIQRKWDPKYDEIDEKGIVKWNLTINSGEKKDIVYSLTIKHPKEMSIEGL